ncbi:hypothetical protein [Piscinibacter sakaiensis]|uniref:hypothetical protein n=1 Tax=Piscinibacter sakaiensis TaxID=1547922 RepID=UPI003AACEBF0
MNTFNDSDRYTPEMLAAMHDAAKRQAAELRAQAISDFWDRIGDALATRQWQARRAAERFARSLARHARRRAAAAPAKPSQACC